MANKIYIYVDDIRIPEKVCARDTCFVLARTYAEAIQHIDAAMDLGQEILLDLDHDLGEEKSGYDIAKYVIENQYGNVKYRIHSMNIVGVKNMRQLLDHYNVERF